MQKVNFDGLDPNFPEFDSFEEFVEFLHDEETGVFDYRQLQCLNYRTGVPIHSLRIDLEAEGFKLAPRPVPRRIRGFSSNSHDRWFGPGSSPTHGGSGWENITGFAGQEG
jgi:hypothetical protein